MFDTLKIYTRKAIPLEAVTRKLTELGYQRVEAVGEEGDFAVRGDTLEVFPVNFNFPLRIEWEFDLIEKIYSFDSTLQRKIIDYDLLIIIPHVKKHKRYTTEDLPIEAVLRIRKGDYVVHSRYGIGRFLGVKKLTVRDAQEYFFEIEYDKKDKLYVSKEDAHLVQKYVRFTLKAPRLTRLGTKEWTRTKERVRQGIKEFALQMLRIDAQRKLIGGFAFSQDTQWQEIFEKQFPYVETEDQTKSLIEVKEDMESAGCMDRIICGDVGYGKTEVALRAVFKAVMDHKQVGVLVPTTILAYQHYTNLLKRTEAFPIRVEMLSRFRTPAQQRTVLQDLAAGLVDIVVGTHRLLSEDVSFNDLGLLVVDEEHKFGVEHKERIKRMRVGIDVVTLTATPIPRTLYMGLIGLRGISLIKTPPQDRRAVTTKVVEFSPVLMKEAIEKEVRRKGQVFVVHNRIEGIAKIESVLRKVLSGDIRLAVVHGKLGAREIEKVMLDFIEHRIDCLLSTAIVESGIDIPSANTIIITDAHMFGLADLHQLRGRVGRRNVQAYAYLVIPSRRSISSEALGRLQMVEEFSHLGAGFEVAMSDLELRGAGNILGKKQHGFVWMVGFDLYCRLLKKEIEYLTDAFKLNQDKGD